MQEHEAAHCLLSLAQKTSPPPQNSQENYSSTSTSSFNLNEYSILKDDKFLKNPEQITQVNNTSFAKNKILDESSVNFSATRHFSEVMDINTTTSQDNLSQYLGRSSTVRPLTYPYQKNIEDDVTVSEKQDGIENTQIQESYQENHRGVIKMAEKNIETREKVSSPNVIKQMVNSTKNEFSMQNLEGNLPTSIVIRKRKFSSESDVQNKISRPDENFNPIDLSSTILINDSPILDLSPASNTSESVINYNGTLNKNEYYPKSPEIYNKTVTESVPNIRTNTTNFVSRLLKVPNSDEAYFGQKIRNNSFSSTKSEQEIYIYDRPSVSPIQRPRTSSFSGIIKPFEDQSNERTSENFINYLPTSKSRHSSFSESNSSETFSQNSDITDKLQKPQDENIENPNVIYKSTSFESVSQNQNEQDQSAMQTLAEIAIKQMKNEKNIMAKSVASEYLKLALKNECNSNESTSDGMKKFNSNKETNELIVKPEENKNCSICSKNFSKPSQLR